MKVGDTIYKFDGSRRAYTKPAYGHIWGELIYEHQFEPLVITGETKRSWLVREYGRDTKIDKQTLKSSGDRGHQWYSEEGKAGHLWMREHRPKIMRLFEQADYRTIREIAKLLGYTLND